MSTRGISIAVNVQLVTEECCNCHVVFAFPSELYDLCQERRGPNGRQFYCPNGHAQHYTGESEAARLKRELEQTQKTLAGAQGNLQFYREYSERREAEVHTLNNQVRAQKAAKTRLLRRVTNGACPCCKRHFANVERHMQTKHPGEVVTASGALNQE